MTNTTDKSKLQANVSLSIEQSDMQDILKATQSRPYELFLLDAARHVVGKRRYTEAMHKSELDVTDNESHLWDDALSLAKERLTDFDSVARTNRLIRSMAAIDKVFFNAPNLNALCVGPRTEMELLSLVGHGFKPHNIRGLDLISYSPWIDVGNAHAMPYEDDSFDVVIVGWVLVYSSEPEQICYEVARVARSGAVVAIGSTYWPEEKRRREAPGRTADHYPLVDDILRRFEPLVDKVYVRHDPPNLDEEGRTIVVFDIDKDKKGL